MTPPNSFSTESKALLILGLPLVGSHVAQVLIGISDTMMLGWYDVTALAAVTIAGSVFFACLIVSSGFAWGAMSLVADAAAQGDVAKVRRATRMAMWLSCGAGALFIPPLWFGEQILLAIGQQPEVATLAQGYLRILAPALIPNMVVMALKSYLSGLERTQVILWVTLAMAGLNVVLNYALIFGNFGAPEMGIRGAGLASLSVAMASAVVMAIYVLRTFPEHELFARFWRPDWLGLREVFRLGWPIGLTHLAEVSLFGIAAVMMGWIGTLPLAAHGIALQIASLTFVVHLGLSQAATVRAGRAVGRRDPQGLRRAGIAAFALSLVFVSVTIATFLLIPDVLISLFLDPNEVQRPQIMAIAVQLLAMAALFQLVDAAQVMALGLLRGLHDTQWPMVYAILSYWGLGVPAAYLLGFMTPLGALGIWAGLTLGLLVAAGLLTLRFVRLSARPLPQGEAP